ncbi:MAG: carotenoid biosynthesis protein [Candidatus Rokubacteria bacterium]|nr:carotenoid biosynthesis protein [Candidatus Rokubacteria bacterium]MBI3826639.1 carotenoid biosynthesis protein [Candidatus Rokubacteria bacterium]
MDIAHEAALLWGTFLLRPYVFAFLAGFLVAGALDLGARRTLAFGAIVWPLAWLSEFSSTRTGIPFGYYAYTGATRGRELYLADVPLMDCLSFTFLAYASLCLARLTLGQGERRRWPIALAAGFFMMAIDVVIDPLAVRGERWFLGRIFEYPAGGVYFGVPLSNFCGWWLVGTAGVGLFLALGGGVTGRLLWPGVTLYYAVLGFNATMTALIGEGRLMLAGLAIHAALLLALVYVGRRAAPRRGLGARRVQRA